MPSLSTLGRLLFAISMIAFGIQQHLTGSFVRLVPLLHFSPLAHGTASILVVTGVVIAIGRNARWAAGLLSALLLLAILFLHLPKVATNPMAGFMWTNPAKALAMLGGMIILAGALPPDEAGSALARLFQKLAPLGPLFLAGFLILGGIQHFVYLDFVTKLVPSWVPSPQLWVYFTGLALIAGGVGILLPKTARLAALMTGIMILLWVLLLHIPRAVADPHNPGETSGVFEALAFSGVAFILAERARALLHHRHSGLEEADESRG